MEIEKQRGISVATSVMGFNYQDIKINLLDTPGHQDFAEDTYRTLTAVDSVIMVIDCVKGCRNPNGETDGGLPYAQHACDLFYQ